MKKRVEKKSVKGFVVTELALVATALALAAGLVLPAASDSTGQQARDTSGVAWVSGSGGIRGR